MYSGKVTPPKPWPKRNDMPRPKKRGGNMNKIRKETCQVDDTVILANLIEMSREHGISITIKTLQGDVYTGILMSVVSFNVATVGVPALYMRLEIEDSQRHEGHVVIPASSIDSMTFATEEGLLDDLVK